MKICFALVGAIVSATVFPVSGFATPGESSAGVRSSDAPVPTIHFQNSDHLLRFEILTDELIHFEYAPLPSAPVLPEKIPVTTFVFKTNYPGPLNLSVSPEANAAAADSRVITTARAQITVDSNTLCFVVKDVKQQTVLTRACPSFQAPGNSLTLDPMQMQNVYGLGEQFQNVGVTNGDWVGKIRSPGNKYGNAIVRFGGGGLGNAQFPIMYALGPDQLNYALFLDTVYPYQWDFTSSPWKIDQTQKGSDPNLRGYFIVGDDLQKLRASYMDLVGRPPVPPRKAFGLWVSEYGYQNWNEIHGKLESLRENHFPVDGFVLDLFWFGGHDDDSPTSPMGLLDWNTQKFHHPAKTVKNFFENDGVGIMTIEESFVSDGLANFKSMADRGFLAKNGCLTCDPTIFDAWWGEGGMIDWSNPLAGEAWHQEHRQKLADIGVTFHWTDLGEPENWSDKNVYANGRTEADVHNTYNFLWHKSIFDGYEKTYNGSDEKTDKDDPIFSQKNSQQLRHFILSRSGGSGMQRFGSAMWSGDIGSNLPSLASHLAVQMQMSLSGMDYFGADTGGFNRLALQGDMGEVYTKWLAHSSLFDVPVRPHADDGTKKNETCPSKIGDLKGNLFNLRQRYELAPYYYSLAYRAHQSGEAVIPPLVYYFQGDQKARLIADEKMIGPDLLVATGAELGITDRPVYLPAGDWYEYHSLIRYHSQGESFPKISFIGSEVEDRGVFRLPVFVRRGAILPKAQVDDLSMNILGKRTDGSRIDDLILEVVASEEATHFDLVEDDGLTESYREGAFATTSISQQQTSHTETVNVAPTLGTYKDAPAKRRMRVALVLTDNKAVEIQFNGKSLNHCFSEAELELLGQGWAVDARGTVHVLTHELAVNQLKTLVVKLQTLDRF